ncbi:MAG: glycosyltransferase family 2 protein [Phenylobacterium sp.]
MGNATPASPSEGTPVLSLCLATYNRARYLDRYLTHHLGALDAAGIDYELVVSDNCSTDETPEILARYSARHPRMRVSRQPRNLGAYPNILTTLHQARGQVVVSIADDDLAITERLLDYVQRMVDDPALVMIQSPWLLMDETRDNAVIGKFYDFDGDWRFLSGQYGNCLAFVLQHHVFPECWIMRRSAIPSIAGPIPKFAYSFFHMLANALWKGDVLFCPEPHLAATAIAKGANAKVGNAEAMESWDVYRGGLELMASYARQFNPGALPNATSVGGVITDFVCERMAVAARLQVHARNWSNAYQILRRLHAYELRPDVGVEHDDIARLAAIETAFVECGQLGAGEIVVAADIPDHILERMNPVEGAALVRIAGADAVRRAYCSLGAAADAAMGEQDFCCDVLKVMERFPIFPGPEG